MLRYNATVLRVGDTTRADATFGDAHGLVVSKDRADGEIRAVIRPIEQRLDRIEVKQENTIKRLDKLEEKR